MDQGEVTAAAPHGSVAIAPVNHLDGLDGFLAPFGCGGWLKNLVTQSPQINLLKNVEFFAPIPRDPKRTDG